MKKLLPSTLLILSAMLVFTGCSKTVDPVWMVYEEAGCRPPWAAKTDHRTRNNLEAVLRADGIIPLKIRIKGDRNTNCEDCDCFTGKTYHVQIDQSQVAWLYYYGFDND
jgi:hypothetical protein